MERSGADARDRPGRRERAACSCSPGWTTRRCGGRARAARPGSGAGRARSSGTRARPRATRWRSRRCATTATATRSCSACGRPARPATPERSRASLRGSGAGSTSGRCERPTGSYVVSLLDDPALAARKVGEEGLEAALAGAGESDERVVEEVADVVFHAYVLLAARGIGLEAVEAELRRRAAEG